MSFCLTAVQDDPLGILLLVIVVRPGPVNDLKGTVHLGPNSSVNGEFII